VPLLKVVVFETLITAVLNEIPTDPTVLTVVRDITRDHAKDEGHHHRYFAGLFHELWHQLDPSVRGPVAHPLPELITACLNWDIELVHSSLVLAGIDASVARDVVHDCYRGSAGERVADICRATMRVYRSAGVFEMPGAAEAFTSRGLPPEN
jgi:para-aminobenzoate N-oxygenase AurF